MKRFWVAISIFLFIFGCFIFSTTLHAQTPAVLPDKVASDRSQKLATMFEKIKEGATTEKEILEWLGKPDQISDHGPKFNYKTFIYKNICSSAKSNIVEYQIQLSKLTGIVMRKTPQLALPPSFKPVIYLYPVQKDEIFVRLQYDGNIFVSYPKYDENIKGWKVIADPEGRLTDLSDGREYSYLFWEGVPSQLVVYDFSKGFIVEGEKTVEFLQDVLKKFGLTPKEYNEFIVYWYPKMKDNKYNLVHFAGAEYENTARLDITPKPDSVLRVFMVYKSVDQKIDITAQEIKPFVRNGFTVVEWGGTEIR